MVCNFLHHRIRVSLIVFRSFLGSCAHIPIVTTDFSVVVASVGSSYIHVTASYTCRLPVWSCYVEILKLITVTTVTVYTIEGGLLTHAMEARCCDCNYRGWPAIELTTVTVL